MVTDGDNVALAVAQVLSYVETCFKQCQLVERAIPLTGMASAY